MVTVSQDKNNKQSEQESPEIEYFLQEKFNPSSPMVSVIMAVYNTKEEWLREAIESILQQTYKNFELIMIDDGSTNNVSKVIKSYTDERIRYIYQENQGAAGSRNNGIKQARGKYIAIMDSDDVSLPTRLEKEVLFLEKNNDYSIVGSNAAIINQGKNIIVTKEPKIVDCIKECPFVHSTVMYKRQRFLDLNYTYDLNMPPTEDYHLWSRVLKTEKAHNIQECLVCYRSEGQGISSTKKEIGERNTINIQKELLNSLTSDAIMQNNIIDAMYKNNKIEKSFKEKLFSLKNFKKFNRKYKILTVLGFEIIIGTKRYYDV